MQSLIVILNLLFFAMPAPSEAFFGPEAVSLALESLQTLENIKMGLLRYATFKIGSGLKSLIVDKIGGKDNTFGDFLTELKNVELRGECLLAVYKVKFNPPGGGEQEKLVLFEVTPKTALLSDIILYSGIKNILRRVVPGIAVEFKVTDTDDLTFPQIVEKLSTQ